LAGLRCSQLDAQATFEPMIEVGLVDSLDHLDHLHGCVPFFALGTASTAAVDTGLLPAISCSVAYRAPAGAPWHSFRTSKWRKGGGSRASDSD
jgi:hypothetical protein